MKKFYALICAGVMLLALIFSGCAATGGSEADQTVPQTVRGGTQPESETAPEQTGTVTPAEGGESSAFTDVFPECPETVLAFLYNEPFRSGTPAATEVWNEGAYDRLYLVPRYVGMTLRAYAVTPTDDGDLNYAPEPSFTTVAEDGCVISASLNRPEGFPAWYVEAELPDGQRTGMLLEYNGRYGTLQYEFLEHADMETLFGEPMEPWIIREGLGMVSEKVFWDFWHGAEAAGVTSFAEAGRYFSKITEIGDGAAFTRTEAGDFYDGSYSFQIARIRENYNPDEPATLREAVQYQYQTFLEIGNEGGILGMNPEDEDELYYQLTGVSVFNPLLAAREVELLVNGESLGTYTLAEDQFCTLIPLELPRLVADRPIDVQVRVIATNFGAPEDALLYAEGGISGNISGAR